MQLVAYMPRCIKMTITCNACLFTQKFGFPFRLYDGFDVLKNDFPEFIFPNEVKANFEAAPSGHINPRQLIKAQLAFAGSAVQR